MSAKPKALLSWSTGKDSAYALAEVRRTGELEIVGHLTTVTRDIDRVSMHGVRRELLQRQAAACHLPIRTVEIPLPCPNEVYERAFASELVQARAAGIEHVIFGNCSSRTSARIAKRSSPRSAWLASSRCGDATVPFSYGRWSRAESAPR